jgi:hypothetical protein
MHGPIINVGRHSLNGLAIIVDARIPLRFLLICDVVFSTSLNALLFHSNDSLGKKFTRQPRVGTEALPIPASISRPSQRARYWSEGNMGTFANELISHVLSADVSQVSVP